MKITIASRQSDLARLQAFSVAEAIKSKKPEIDVEFNFSKSAGDKDLDSLLSSFGDKGAFTQDFYKGLVDGEHDIVVHSWKDLPTEERPGTEVVATLEREDVRDLILFKKSVKTDKPLKLTVLSSSPRRVYNLEPFLKKYLPFPVEQIKFKPVRGNIETRLRKLAEDSEAHAIVVAKAAIDRQLLTNVEELQQAKQRIQSYVDQFCWMVTPLSENPAAPAQGALAVEINSSRNDLKDLFSQLNSVHDFRNVVEEREVLSSYGGGCHQKIGVTVLTKPYGKIKYLKGLTDDGVVLNEFYFQSKKSLPIELTGAEHFPSEVDSPSFFNREHLSISEEQKALIKNAKGIRVARANALTEEAKESISENSIVWVSGLQTWQKLSAEGVWVNGCDDGLGECESPRLKALAGDFDWVKLSHDKSPSKEGFQSIPTYKLKAKDKRPDLQGRKAYYWMSASSYEQAVSLDEDIKQAEHFCGPGNTYTELKKHISKNLYIFPNVNTWRKWVSGEGN